MQVQDGGAHSQQQTFCRAICAGTGERVQAMCSKQSAFESPNTSSHGCTPTLTSQNSEPTKIQHATSAQGSLCTSSNCAATTHTVKKQQTYGTQKARRPCCLGTLRPLNRAEKGCSLPWQVVSAACFGGNGTGMRDRVPAERKLDQSLEVQSPQRPKDLAPRRGRQCRGSGRCGTGPDLDDFRRARTSCTLHVPDRNCVT